MKPRVNPLSPKFAWRVLDDEGTLIDLATRTVHCFNPVATFIWEQMAQGAADADVIAAVCDAFDVDAATAQRDLQEFVAALARLGLVAAGARDAEQAGVGAGP